LAPPYRVDGGNDVVVQAERVEPQRAERLERGRRLPVQSTKAGRRHRSELPERRPTPLVEAEQRIRDLGPATS